MDDPNDALVTVTPRELRWVKPLGSGSFGLVSLCKYLNAPRAVKVLTAADKGVEWNPKVLKSLTWQERILIPAEHGTSSSGDPMYLASYAENHDLSILLERGSSLQRLVKIATEVAEGMNYLHSKQPVIAHLDLKPANVLLTRDYQAKIADLGMAAVLSDISYDQMASLKPGTLLYAAPELLRGAAFLQPAAPAAGPAGQPQGNDMLMTKADVFSFGIMLYEMMLSLCQPRVDLVDAYEQAAEELNARDCAPRSYFFQMFRTHYPDARPSYPLPDNVPTAIKELIDSCWASDPQMRPSFQQIHDRLQLARQSLGPLPVDPPMAARDPRVPRMTSLVPAQVLLPAEAGLPLGAAAGQLPPAAGSSVPGPGSSDGWVSPFAVMALLPFGGLGTAGQLHQTMYSSCRSGEIFLLRQAFPEQVALHTAEEVGQIVDRQLAGTKVSRWLKQAVAQLPAGWKYSNKELRQLAADMKAAVGAARAEGFEQLDMMQGSCLLNRERRVAILDLLPLTWTATDWLIGAWGALVLRSKREQPVQASGGATSRGPEQVKKVVSRQSLLAAVGSAEELQVLAPADAADIRGVLLAGKEEAVALHEVLEGLHALVRAPEEPEDGSMPFFENELVERRLREEKERKRQLEAREAKLSAEWLTQYNEKRLPEGIEFLRGLKEQLGGRYPDALFLPPTVDQDTKDRAFQIMRDSWTLWDEIEKQHNLGTISDEFFRRDVRWVGRGQECRELVEPVDIANWYMKNKQWQYKEMYNCVEAGYHYAAGIDDEAAEMAVDNDRRPTRYMLLQRLEKEVFRRDPLRTVEIARRFERAFGNRKWEDVLAEQGKQQGQAQQGTTMGDIRAVSDQQEQQ